MTTEQIKKMQIEINKFKSTNAKMQKTFNSINRNSIIVVVLAVIAVTFSILFI